MNNNNNVYKPLVKNINEYQGKYFDESWYKYIIDSDNDGYYTDSSGFKRVLFKFRKEQLSHKLMNLAINSFLNYSKKKHSNRGIASGIPDSRKTARVITKTGQNEGQYIASNISGYYDKPLREHLGVLGTSIACRTTAFTLKNKELWEQALPFIIRCSRLYKELGGKYYNAQKKHYQTINESVKIPKTVFTTITSNYNWRTACHRDTGDYSSGLGNLVVVGNGFKGGWLGFPEFKVLIKIQPGDFLLMDVHQWHCNTSIEITNEKGFRLSFVMYIRESMAKCKKSRKIGEIDYLINESTESANIRV